MKRNNRRTTCMKDADSITSKARTEVSQHNKARKQEVAMYRYCLGMGLLIAGLTATISLVDAKKVEANAVINVEPISIGNIAEVTYFEENQKEEARELVGKIEGRLQAASDDKVAQMLLDISPRETDIVATNLEEGPADVEDISEASGPALENVESDQVDQVEQSGLVELNVPGPLLDVANIDRNYKSAPLYISGQNRRDLESLVYNEAGSEGFIGASLVAQTIRDQMNFSGVTSARQIKSKYGYSGAINGKTNAVAKQAVAYIFDEGGMAVQHRLFYFYAPRLCKSSFHESQNFVVEYRGHRVFDRR